MQNDDCSPPGARSTEPPVAAEGAKAPLPPYVFGKYFWLTLLLFILTVVCVNPFWNTAIDDDWSYALTVKHLLDTGHYKLHDWATANMPFQAYWGAGFAKLVGYSHASLRISTLALWLVGLIAFYCLGLEHGFAPDEAGLLMLMLFSSPILLKMSFSFMTDVPYLSCFLTTLFIWTRALRTRQLGLMFLGSIAAAAAILTRQVGVALIGGLILVWLAHKGRARNAALLGIGLLLPLVALGWQLRQVSVAPTWAMKWNLFQQAGYFSDPNTLLKSLWWRPVIALQYLAFFTPPLVLLPLAGLMDRRRRAAGGGPARTSGTRLLLLVGVWVVAVLAVASQWRAAPWPLPYVPTQFRILEQGPVFARVLLAGLTTLGAILLGWTFAGRYLSAGPWHESHRSERLIDLTTLCVVGGVLAFWVLEDEYLLPLLPYGLLIVGRQFRSALDRLKRPLAAACFAVLALSVMSARSHLAWTEAYWSAGEAIRTTGVEACEISSSFEWVGYHCFEKFLAEHRNDPPDMQIYLDWLATQRVRGKYLVIGNLASVDLRKYEPVVQMTCTLLPYWHRRLYVLKKIDPLPPK